MNVPGGYHISVINNSFKFIWVTKLKILGGNLLGFVSPSIGYGQTSAGGRTQSLVAFSDFNFAGAINWHWKTFHHFVEIDGWVT